MGEIRRAGGQAKLISGCFEFSIKRRCCPTDEQSFHQSLAGYKSAAKALETFWIPLVSSFYFCWLFQCNLVNRVLDHGYQAVVICSDTLILLCLQKEQPGHQLFCSLSLRNKGKNTYGSVIKNTTICSSSKPVRLFPCQGWTAPAASQSQAMGLPSQVLQPKNAFTKSIYIFSDTYSIAMLLVFTDLYSKLNNTSSTLPVLELGAKGLHPIHLPSQPPASKGTLWRRLMTTVFIYTVQNQQYSFPTATAHYKHSSAHQNYFSNVFLQVFHSKFDSQAH